MSKKKRKDLVPPYEFKMDMTPMIDVTFQLLIFFMCTIKFKTLEGKLSAYLPKDVGVNSSDAEPLEKVDIQVKVVKEGTKLDPVSKVGAMWSGTGPFRYGDDRVIRYALGPKQMTDWGELKDRLEVVHKAEPDRAATIDAFPGTVYADMTAVLDAAVQAGFNDITFKGARVPKGQ